MVKRLHKTKKYKHKNTKTRKNRKTRKNILNGGKPPKVKSLNITPLKINHSDLFKIFPKIHEDLMTQQIDRTKHNFNNINRLYGNRTSSEFVKEQLKLSQLYKQILMKNLNNKHVNKNMNLTELPENGIVEHNGYKIQAVPAQLGNSKFILFKLLR